jgi:hypothetical protein
MQATLRGREPIRIKVASGRPFGWGSGPALPLDKLGGRFAEGT